MKTITTLSIVALTALLIGCGGGSSSSTPASNTTGGSTSSNSDIVGHLVDAPVEGVFYSCGGPNYRGFTDKEGSFYCENSSVEFYIGKLSLGSVNIPTADGNVYPQDLVGVSRTDFTNPKVIKMTQLLQSLDEDTLPSNGIKIAKTVGDKFTTGMQFSTKSIETLVSLAGVSKIDASSAIEHLKETMGQAVSSSSSSSSEVSSQSSSSTPTAVDGQSIDSANLSGMTVVAEYRSGTKVKNIQKISYIFLSNNESITVFDLFDGSRKVAHSTYHESDGNNVAMLNPTFDNGETFMPAFGISSPNSVDFITVGESTAVYKVTAIIDNANNGIDEATVTSTAVEEPNANENAPMYDTLNGKSLSIYNNVSTSLINDIQYTQEYAGNTRYDSNVALHCTDYGYTEIFVEGTTDGTHSKTYFLPEDTNKICMEFDYTNASKGSGSNNAVWYKQ